MSIGSDGGFLKRIAKKLLSEAKYPIYKYAVVFPNRRSGIYLKKFLGELSEGPVFSPSVFSIDDFISECSGMKIPENFELIFELYSVYVDIFKKGFLKFEDFFREGKIILDDFNEIDKSLTDPGKIFRELKNFNETGNIGSERFSDLWTNLERVYREFKIRLSSKRSGYMGMAVKSVAEDLELILDKGWENILFAGFNALSGAEKKIISGLKRINKAEILFEMDSYFMNNRDQEAGKFIRAYKKEKIFGDEIGVIENDLVEKQREIKILSTSSFSGQAVIIGKYLEQESWENIKREDIAIVLPDESLLFPILNSLPKNIAKGNISIGFPLSQTSAYSLTNLILEMHINSEDEFFRKDILNLLGHPYMKIVFPEIVSEVKEEINKMGELKLLDKKSGDRLFLSVFNYNSDGIKLLEVIMEIFERLNTIIEKESDILPGIEMEFVFHFYTLLLKLKDVMVRTGIFPGIRGFKKLISELALTTHIPFTGEPLEGIQILGLLEARNIEFKKLFILSLNEGVFPKKEKRQTYIPALVRKNNGLQIDSDPDAVAAYIFYRLIKNSTDITLIYTDESTGNNRGEKSRFINQILMEYSDRSKNLILKESPVVFPVESLNMGEVKIKKRSEHIEQLEKLSFSASSLKLYLLCPLRFYFRYILGLKDVKTDEDSQDPAIFGELIHSVLEEIYLPVSGRSVEFNYFDSLRADKIDSLIKRAFIKKGINEVKTGKNRITFEILKEFVSAFINKEKNESPFKIIGLEKEIISRNFEFGSGNNRYKIDLKGRIDRIDIKNGIYRIIDYKSGRTSGLKVKNGIGDIENWGRFPEIFQMLFYSLLIKSSGLISQGFMLGIYPFKKIYEKLSYIDINNNKIISSEIIEEFSEILDRLFAEIFDPNVPFSQTKDITNCGFCPFVNICVKDKRRNS